MYKDCNSCYAALLDSETMCKTINDEGPIYLNDMCALNQNSRKNISLIQPKFSTKKYGFKSIPYQGSKSSVESTRE